MLITMRKQNNDGLNELVKDVLNDKKDLIGIEIGSYRGESTEIFLKSNAFKKLYCIDPWEPGYDPFDAAGSKEIVLAEKEFDEKFRDNNIIVKLKFKSSDIPDLFLNESIDFIYIDANHQYKFVKEDIINYLPKIKIGGIISGHDYDWAGPRNAVNDYFKKPPVKIYPDNSWLYIKEKE